MLNVGKGVSSAAHVLTLIMLAAGATALSTLPNALANTQTPAATSASVTARLDDATPAAIQFGGIINQANIAYYRMPALRGDTIVFLAEGDLWRVPVAGGQAARLTTQLADEAHPAISPDGKTLAFVGAYDGVPEVYTMPIDGGLPTRRSWGLARSGFVGFHPDGRVMFSTRQYSTLPSSQLVLVDMTTGAEELVPLSEADQGAYDASSGTLFFTRMPFQGSHTKRYKGGYIQQLWKFERGSAEATPLTTDFDGTSKEVMLWQGRMYFLTDRDGVMNIWSSALDGKDLKQHTFHTDFDASSPELDSGRIVYAHAGDVRLLDIASNKDDVVRITLATDLEQMREKFVKEPAKSISAVNLSHTGDRVVITARGRVFVVPVKADHGRIVEVGSTPGVRYRHAIFAPDGKAVIASSDRSGEVEFWSLPSNGVGEIKQLTRDSTVLRWEGVISPDGKTLAHSDKNQKFSVTDVETGATKLITTSTLDRVSDYSWSPDGRWLVYVELAGNVAQQIKLYSMETGQVTPITSDRFESFSPRFSADGKWLYFLSDRNIESSTPSPWGPMSPQPNFDRLTKIYHVALKAGERSPWQTADELFDPKAAKKKEEDKKKDEEKKAADKPKDDAEKKPEDKKPDDAKKVPAVEIDLEGIQSRLRVVPVKPGNYSRLRMGENAIFFAESGTPFERDDGGPAGFSVKGVAIGNEKIEVKTIASGIKSLEISGDRKKLLLYTGSSIHVADATPAPAEMDKASVSLSGWTMSYVPMTEYRQLYADAWRLLRDYFYDVNMHGVDWPALRLKYAPFVERVRSRAELNEVLAQLTGELSALHHFVRGGDFRDTLETIQLSYLGAEWKRDEARAGWTITRVYQHDPDDPERAAPLSVPGVDVKAGDTIVAINGRSTLEVPHPAALLRAKAGQQVLLRVRPAGASSAEGERDVIVRPISAASLSDLRYTDWEYSRRQMVETASNNRIGYVHLRAMGKENISEWARGYYPAFNRDGLIIDVRRNNGGNIDSWILGQLLRKAWMFWNQRVGSSPNWNMQYAFRGHVVVICDGFTASDGEAFAEGFRRLGLGKVLGMRTWGGEIWLSSSNDLADGGLASAGEYGVFVSEGVWIVEGRGVEPDIVVDNPPHATFKGQDAQLTRAIEHLQQLIKEKPIQPNIAPALPVKNVKTGPGANAPK